MEGVVEVVKVGAEAGGGEVDVGLGAVADCPAEDVGGFLDDAVGEEGGGCVGGAGLDSGIWG